MQLFYSPDLPTILELDKENSVHCIKVLRKKKGDIIDLIDGKGNFYKATLLDENPKKSSFSLIETTKETPLHKGYIHIGIAPTKNISRIEWFVEKVIEIGIDEISFVKCLNSERKEINIGRVEKIAIAAIKQSLRATLPKINAISTLNDFVKNSNSKNCFVANFHPNSKPLTEQNVDEEVLLLVGPEGDFDNSELEFLIKNDFKIVNLGNSRLRTETAGIVACTLLVNNSN